MSRPIGVSLLHDSQQLFCIFCIFLSQSWNLYVPILILKNIEYGLLIQQIETLSSVYLKDAHNNSEILLGEFEQLLHDEFLQPIHRVSLPGACLPIGEAGDDTLFDKQPE